MDTFKNIINIDADILGGQPVFAGTRVPIESMFMHLAKEISLNEFLADFPSVKKDAAVSVLELASKIICSKNFALKDGK